MIVEKIIEIPEEVKVEIKDNLITVSCKDKEVKKKINFENVRSTVEGTKIRLFVEYPKKRDYALIGTIEAHIKNMIKGVTEGHRYRMKILYSHFPIQIKVQDNKVVIMNFLGERSPRYAKILPKVKVTVKDKEIILEGPDKENVGQSAANIELATRIKNRDPRVFQDGIYIISKD